MSNEKENYSPLARGVGQAIDPLLPDSVEGARVASGLGKGILAGGSIAAIVALIRHLNEVKAEAKRNNPNYEDDNTLFMDIPDATRPAKSAGVEVTGRVDNGMNYAGWLLALGGGTVGGYLAVDKLINMYRKQQAQAMLDKAQVQMLRKEHGIDPETDARLSLAAGMTSGEIAAANAVEAAKKANAGEEFGTISKVVGGGLGLMGLLAVASALATNKILDEAYPLPKVKTSLPKKVVVRRVGVGLSDDEKEELADLEAEIKKPKNLPGNTGMEKHVELERVPPAAIEGVAHSVLGSPAKVASTSDIRDMLSMIAHGHGYYVADGLVHNPDALFENIKGASITLPVTPRQLDLAVKWASVHPHVSPTFALMCASELNDMSPGLVKMASNLPEGLQDKLLTLGALHACACTETYSVKLAAAMRTLVPSMATLGIVQQAVDASGKGETISAKEEAEEKAEAESLKKQLEEIDIDSVDPEVKLMIEAALKREVDEQTNKTEAEDSARNE